jgi:hypothetical protein
MKIRSISSLERETMPAPDAHSVPMIRLFDRRDIEFLRAEPGYSTRMESDFRRRRCRIFRGYLRSLRAEFLAAQTELETLRIESPADYEPLAMMLMRCRVRLASAMIPAYLCLMQYRWDLGNTSLGPLVRRLESIRAEIRNWVPEIS